MKKRINKKLLISTFCILGLTVGMKSDYAKADSNILMDIKIEENKKYLDIEQYVKSTGGFFKQELLENGTNRYVANFLSAKTGKYYRVEFFENKNVAKIGDKYIANEFKEMSGYLVPDNEGKIFIENNKVYVPVSMFTTIFKGNIKEENKIELSKELGEYIEENLKSFYKEKPEEEIKEETSEKENSNDNVNSDKDSTDVEEPKPPVEEPKPPVEEPKPPVEEPKPPIEEPTPPAEEPPVEEPKPEPPIEEPKPEPPVEEPKPEPPADEPKPPAEEKPAEESQEQAVSEIGALDELKDIEG